MAQVDVQAAERVDVSEEELRLKNCPVFTKGCPFKEGEAEAAFKGVKDCPAFKDGCAFKEVSLLYVYHI